jgi:hypothetical protein
MILPTAWTTEINKHCIVVFPHKPTTNGNNPRIVNCHERLLAFTRLEVTRNGCRSLKQEQALTICHKIGDLPRSTNSEVRNAIWHWHSLQADLGHAEHPFAGQFLDPGIGRHSMCHKGDSCSSLFRFLYCKNCRLMISSYLSAHPSQHWFWETR